MKNLIVNLKKKIVNLEGTKKYWWETKHKSSSSSEDATDTRIWYAESKKHGYVDDEKIKISSIRKLEERQGGEPLDWTPAEHRITTPEKLAQLDKLVDDAEKEQRRHPQKVRPMKPPSIKRISKNKCEIDCGKHVYRQKTAYDRWTNEIAVWYRRKHGDHEWQREPNNAIEKALDKVVAEFKESEIRKGSKQRGSASGKNPEISSKRKRPKFAERNKHGGLIVHGLANSGYYTRFDIGKSKKYPRGFTFRVGRGKFFIQETLDRESLAAIEKEISWILRS